MKKNMIVVIAMGLLTFGAISASAASSCCNDGKCSDKQALAQFKQETAVFSNALKAKDIELRELYGFDSFDTRKASALEDELRELKGKINAAAEKNRISTCCIS